MKFIKSQFLFESKQNNKTYYTPKNLIIEICTSMTLLNNEFLDNILDRGLKARYSENSQVFLTDLKNLLLSKNRLDLGKFVDGKCVSDDEVSKINGLFDEVEFNIDNPHMTREIRAIKWCTLDEAITMIRPDNIDKREVLLKAGKIMKNFYPIYTHDSF